MNLALRAARHACAAFTSRRGYMRRTQCTLTVTVAGGDGLSASSHVTSYVARLLWIEKSGRGLVSRDASREL